MVSRISVFEKTKEGLCSFAGSVVGWGFNNAGEISEQLKHVKMPVVSREACIFSYPDFYSQFTFNNTYCAGRLNGITYFA